MTMYFSPGCALFVHKPELAKKVFAALSTEYPDLQEHTICCKHEPKLAQGSRIINICPGCNKRFRELYAGISTVSLWEILAESRNFKFPNYRKRRLKIFDACPTRDRSNIHGSIREVKLPGGAFVATSLRAVIQPSRFGKKRS